MVNVLSCLFVTLLGIGIGVAGEPAKPLVKFTTSQGDITLELDPSRAPVTVENFLGYVRDGYYVGTVFHRVIPGFMVQGGGLDAELVDKADGRKAAIKNESDNGLKNETGTVAMARTSVPDSATSQFFINVKDNGFLDRGEARDGVGYAVFGRVVDGMDVVRKIEAVKTAPKGMHRDAPVDPVFITAAEVLEPAAGADEPPTTLPPPSEEPPAAQAPDAGL